MCTMIVSAATIARPTGTKECRACVVSDVLFYDFNDVNEMAILPAWSSGSHL